MLATETAFPVSIKQDSWIGVPTYPDYPFSYFQVTDERDWRRELARLKLEFESAEFLNSRIILFDQEGYGDYFFYRADLFKSLPVYSKELDTMMESFFEQRPEKAHYSKVELLTDYLLKTLSTNDIKRIRSNTEPNLVSKSVLVVDKIGNIVINKRFKFYHMFFGTHLEEAIILDHFLPEGDTIFKRRQFGEETELQSRKGYIVSII